MNPARLLMLWVYAAAVAAPVPMALSGEAPGEGPRHVRLAYPDGREEAKVLTPGEWAEAEPVAGQSEWFPYTGGTELRIQLDGPRLLIGTDGGPMRLAMVLADEPEGLAAVQDALGATRGPLAISCSASRLDLLPSIPPERELALLVRDAGRSTLGKLSARRNVVSLCLPWVCTEDLTPLSKLTQLRSLHVEGYSLRSIEPLARLPSLRTLRLARTDVSDLTPLAKLNGLVSLDLTESGDVTSLAPLKELPNLRALRLATQLPIWRWSSRVEDVTPVWSLKGLELLDLSGVAAECDLRGAARLPRLTALTIRASEKTDFGHLAALDRLMSLEVIAAAVTAAFDEFDGPGPGRPDLRPLARLAGLSRLAVWGPDDAAVKAIGSLPRLTSLTISGARGAGFSPLARLHQLRELRLLFDTAVDDLRPLAGLTRLRVLELDECSEIDDLSPLAGLRDLRALTLTGFDWTADVAPLVTLDRLTYLNLSGSAPSDLRPIARMTALRHLDLSSTGATDLRPLVALRELRVLNLANARRIADLSPLPKLPHLQRLDLTGCRRLRDLRPLAEAAHLAALKIGCAREMRCVHERFETSNGQGFANVLLMVRVPKDSPRVTDLRPLASLGNLRAIDLSGCFRARRLDGVQGLARVTELSLAGFERVRDLTPLSGMAGLRKLYLDRCTRISDLRPLAKFRDLDTLTLRFCGSVTDLSPLAALPRLRTLDLAGCKNMVELAALAQLTRLEELDLRGCDRVADLAPLAGLTRMVRLDLRGCERIANLSPLANMVCLETLDIGGCANVPNLDPIEELPRLRSLWLKGCRKVSDEQALRIFQRIGEELPMVNGQPYLPLNNRPDPGTPTRTGLQLYDVSDLIIDIDDAERHRKKQLP